MRLFLFFIFCAMSFFIQSIDSNPQPPVITPPKENPDKRIPWGQPLILLSIRNLAEEIEKIAKQEHFVIPKSFFEILATQQMQNLLHKVSGRPAKRQKGYDEGRISVATGKQIKPTLASLTFSGTTDLKIYVAALQEKGLAHHFIIDRNGSVHAVINESVPRHEEGYLTHALSHRLFAVGEGSYIHNGYKELCDMNSEVVSIALIGLDTGITTNEQNKSLILLLKNLYARGINQTVDYGCIAQPYGRRNPQTNLPWSLLAEQGLALWPKAEDLRKNISFLNSKEQAVWVSAALRKLGFLAPNTHNPQHPELQRALAIFQKHYNCTNKDGIISSETMTIINSLLKQAEEKNPMLKDIVPPPLPTR